MSIEPELPPLPHWETLSQEMLADCRIFQVYRKHCRHPVQHREADFYVIHNPDWVMSVAITEDRRLVLVNQFRYGIEEESWELPGGINDPGETPEQCAARELEEETGYIGGTLSYLGCCRPNPAVQDNTSHFILIDGCKPGGTLKWDSNEELQMKTVTLDEAFAMVERGEIKHSIALNALFRLKLHLDKETR